MQYICQVLRASFHSISANPEPSRFEGVRDGGEFLGLAEPVQPLPNDLFPDKVGQRGCYEGQDSIIEVSTVNGAAQAHSMSFGTSHPK
jgi:hypothetical protein